MDEANKSIQSQLNAIFSVHESILNIAEDNNLQSPLIFAGMAVYLCCQPEHFRPGCKKLSGDIDYIVPASDIAKWERSLGLKFTGEESENFTGSAAKTKIDGIEIDLLANSQIKREIAAGSISCSFYYEFLQKFSSPWQNTKYIHIDPAQLLFFKLFLGRGKEQGK